MRNRDREPTTREMLALDGVPEPAELLEVAVEHATYRVPIAGAEQTAGSVRKSLVGEEFESAVDVAVLEDRRLVGLVPIERLLATPDGVTMAEVMDADPPVVSPGVDQELVAWRMVEQAESSVAVVDDQDGFVGLVPPHRMLAVLLHEHDEDLARLGGYVKGTAGARRAAEEGMRDRLWHRLPWIIVGLLGAMLSAVVVGAFERQLDEVLLLAFFLPGVVYLADAVSTQTETVLIRGFSVGIDARSVAAREVLTGSVIGGLVGLVFFPFALVGWGNLEVAAAVALALFAACTIATAVGVLVPWAFKLAKLDPAFGSGPLGTVIQDLLSIVVYLAIAAPIAT